MATFTDNGGGAPNGSDLEFTYTFPVIQTEDVKVSLNGVTQATTKYAVDNVSNPTKITFNNTSVDSSVQETSGAPKSGVRVRVYRETTVGKTDGNEDPKAVFAAGSSIRAIDLNANQEQSLMAIHELQTRPVETEDIEADAITNAKIATDAVNADSIIANAVGSSELADDAVDTAAIQASAVTTNELATDSVNTSKIIDLNVTRGKLEADAIDSTKLADNAVNSEHYVDGSIDHVHLANDIIDGDNIQDDVVNSEHIAAGALDNEHYAAGSITSDKLNGATVVTASEQAAAASNDTSFLTTAAADARFFNVSTGDTIKDGDSFPDNDTTIATTAAINDRIIDLVDDVGGFVPIANETSFPTSNPDVNNGTGTIVSVSAASTNLVPSGTTVTIANGRGSGLAVIITGVSATIPSGFGFLVETTTTAHTYTFHRLSPKSTEVTTVAGISSDVTTVSGIASNVTTVAGISSNVTSVAGNSTNINAVAGNATNINAVAADASDIGIVAADGTDIGLVAGSIANVNTAATNIASINNASANISSVNNFGDTYQVASSNPSQDGGGNDLAEGDLYFNTTANELKVYNGGSWQGGVTASGNFAATTGNTFTGDNVYNDNAKLKLGTGSDLEIFHNANDSIINDAGTGTLKVQSGGNTKIEVTGSGAAVTGNITVSGNVDGRDVAADGTKLDGIESSATADQTAAEIRTLVESASDSNVFTDADHSKLNAIEASATADQTASEIKTLLNSDGIVNANVDASAAIAGTKISPNFGSQNIATTGTLGSNDITISDSTPRLTFSDSDNNPDYQIKVNVGHFVIEDATNTIDKFKINSDGHIDLIGNVDISSGLDVTGNITVSGTVDGIDIATDVAANTAKTTNATHTGDVTGSTSLTIANDAVTTDKILDDAVTADKLANSINTAIEANTAKDLTALNASNLTSGTVPTARLGSGTANNTNFLRGDGSWQVIATPTLDAPVITGGLEVAASAAVTHTISNFSDDVTYAFTPTNCTIGTVNASGQFTVTAAASGTPSYIVKATTTSLGLDDSSNTTKTFTLKLSAPTLNSPANVPANTNVAYTITSTDGTDDRLILDLGSANFTFVSVSHGSGTKTGNTVVVTGFTTNNPVVTVTFTADATYSVKAKAQKIDGSAADSDFSATDSITIADTYYAATGPDGANGVTSGDYVYHKFTSSKTGSNGFVVSQAGTGSHVNTLEYLIVAGGGGCSGDLSGGGGAGGYRLLTGKSIATGNHNVTVGGGGPGTGTNGANGVKGSNSSFNNDSSTGGGLGVNECGTSATHGNGGSGGGGSNCNRALSQGNEGGYSPAEGHAGGLGIDPGSGGRGGGGGGAGGAGGAATGSAVGVGGNGSNSASTYASVLSCGENGYFASGGCGGTSNYGTTSVVAPDGGGANKAYAVGSTNSNGQSGLANTGGGGGGASSSHTGTANNGGAGASGIVLIRYKFQN